MSINTEDKKELEIQFEDLKGRTTTLEALTARIVTLEAGFVTANATITALTARVVLLETWKGTGIDNALHKISSSDSWTPKDVTILGGLITAIEA